MVLVGGVDLAGTSFTLLPIIPLLQLQRPQAEAGGRLTPACTRDV